VAGSRQALLLRAPPVAVEALHRLGVTAVTLANNHALDYGYDALLDTLDVLHEAGIGTTGAGADLDAARRPSRIVVGDTSIAVIGCTDHPAQYAATASRPGVAYSVLGETIDDWVAGAVRSAADDCVIVTPHWGPNMVGEPIDRVRAAAGGLRRAGASIVVGHSAHVFHGMRDRVIFDLGDRPARVVRRRAETRVGGSDRPRLLPYAPCRPGRGLLDPGPLHGGVRRAGHRGARRR
jgi:poly-gamma-glutamate synthesis protein (capsule biosynthesis protein)